MLDPKKCAFHTQLTWKDPIQEAGEAAKGWGEPPNPLGTHYGSMGMTGWFTYMNAMGTHVSFIFKGSNPYIRGLNLHVSWFWGPRVVDLYGKFVGKYTVRPMDPMGYDIALFTGKCLGII